jgi:hypothetical protein
MPDRRRLLLLAAAVILVGIAPANAALAPVEDQLEAVQDLRV